MSEIDLSTNRQVLTLHLLIVLVSISSSRTDDTHIPVIPLVDFVVIPGSSVLQPVHVKYLKDGSGFKSHEWKM